MNLINLFKYLIEIDCYEATSPSAVGEIKSNHKSSINGLTVSPGFKQILK